MILFAALALFGAGCLPAVVAPKMAEQLDNRVTESSPVAQDSGFGTLPSIQVPTRHPHVTINAVFPQIPPNVTIIRLRRGTPNETELRNISSAIGIPAGTVTDHPIQSTLDLSWTDDQGFRWNYKADERALEFSLAQPQKSPLTLSNLPSNDEIMNIANSFLLQRAFDAQSYRNAAVDPDWNNWWLRAKAIGMCMDVESLMNVRAIGSSDPFMASGPPPLPTTASTTCVSPEFPSKAVVRYHAFVDERDVLTSDGTYVDGIEMVIDARSKQVVGGRVALFTNADRSDYPALTADQANALMQNGGLSAITGDVTITSIDFGSYRLESTTGDQRTVYLIPALIGFGTRTNADGTIESVRIVSPLVKQ